MTSQTSVVTPERFARGFTYQEYLAQIKVNKDRFQQFYDECILSQEDASFFHKAARRAHGPAKMLVLGEDWCPDVYRGMPAMARIAEAAGIEMRVFPRDQNLDIMNEFLNRGEFLSIPVAVFYAKDLRYLCHWIERPALANKEQAQFNKEAKRQLPNGTDQEVRALARPMAQARYAAWQQESIREIRELLTQRPGKV